MTASRAGGASTCSATRLRQPGGKLRSSATLVGRQLRASAWPRDGSQAVGVTNKEQCVPHFLLSSRMAHCCWSEAAG